VVGERFAKSFALPIAAILAFASTSCRSTINSSVDALASCLPSDTVAFAGLDLDQIRTSALYQSLLPQILAGIESLRDCSYLLVAYNGRDVLFVGRGKYPEAPAGATLIVPGLIVSGSPESVHSAIAQHQTGSSGAPRLLELAKSVAGGKQAWMIVQGGVTLPLTDNLANLNRILQLSQYVTLAAKIDSRLQLDAAAAGRNASASQKLEESLRAILTFATAAGGHHPELEAALQSIQIRRDDLTVHASLSTTSETAAKLIRAWQ